MVEKRDEGKMNDAVKKIKSFVSQELKGLSPGLALWVEDYLIEPKPIVLIENLYTDNTISIWLVTDHVGKLALLRGCFFIR